MEDTSRSIVVAVFPDRAAASRAAARVIARLPATIVHATVEPVRGRDAYHGQAARSESPARSALINAALHRILSSPRADGGRREQKWAESHHVAEPAAQLTRLALGLGSDAALMLLVVDGMHEHELRATLDGIDVLDTAVIPLDDATSTWFEHIDAETSAPFAA